MEDQTNTIAGQLLGCTLAAVDPDDLAAGFANAPHLLEATRRGLANGSDEMAAFRVAAAAAFIAGHTRPDRQEPLLAAFTAQARDRLPRAWPLLTDQRLGIILAKARMKTRPDLLTAEIAALVKPGDAAFREDCAAVGPFLAGHWTGILVAAQWYQP